MPALRPFLDRRRRSSHAIFSPAKPGVYGIPVRPVTFAPNVTPVSFTETDDTEDDAGDPLASIALAASDVSAGPNVKALNAMLNPSLASNEAAQTAPTRKRCPPGKRRSQGYIPRPPNAFMLFRADFVKQKHVPGSVETNHVSLSKIIGEYWRQLPLDQKRVWEVKAKQEKAAHKAMFPDYRFRPVHNKHKRKAATPDSKSENDDLTKDRQSNTPGDIRRAEEVARLLLEGKDGEDLAKAVRELDIEQELRLGLGSTSGLERDEAYEYNVDSDSRSPSFDPEREPPRGYLPDGSSHSAVLPSAIHTIPVLHMPSSVRPPFGMDFSVQNVPDMLFSSTHNSNSSMAAAYPRRPSSVPLPLPDADWFANPNPFMSASAAPLLDSEDPVEHQQEFSNHQEFNTLNPFSWQLNQAFQQRVSFQFNPAPFGPHQVEPGVPSAPPVLQQTMQQQQQLQQQQLHSHAPIQPDAQGLFHPQPQMFGMQTSARSSLERRASSAGPFFRRSWTMPVPFSSTFASSYDLIPGFNMAVNEPVHLEKDPSPLPDVDPAAAGLFADFSFGETGGASAAATAADARLGGMGGHSRTLSAASQVAVDPTDASAAASVSGMIAPIDTSIPVPPLVHSQSLSSAASSSEGSWGGGMPTTTTTGTGLNPGEYIPANGAYAPSSSVHPDIQVYAPDQMYCMPAPNGMGNEHGVYDPTQSFDVTQTAFGIQIQSQHDHGHGHEEQGGIYGVHGGLSKPVMMGRGIGISAPGAQATEASFPIANFGGRGLVQQVNDGVYFEVA